MGSPGQRLYNCFGACAFYLLPAVAITSYLRRRIGSPLWKLLHYLAYCVAACVIARIRYGRSKAAIRARSLEPSTPGF